MTSLYGTTQAYQPMASTYIALAPECGDNIFGTNVNYCDLAKWGIYDGQEMDPKVLNAYVTQRERGKNNLLIAADKSLKSTDPISYSLSVSNQSSTVWGMIEQLPQLSTFRGLLKRAGWDQYINSANPYFQVTVFAPTNDALKNTAYTHSPVENWNSYNLRVFGQAHTLPFAFDQTQAYQRKLKLHTSLETYSVYLDGTGEVSSKLNFYVPPDRLLNLRYPDALKRINILQGYYTNNGALYLIDGAFDPEVIVY